jgi:hypothetical protein
MQPQAWFPKELATRKQLLDFEKKCVNSARDNKPMQRRYLQRKASRSSKGDCAHLFINVMVSQKRSNDARNSRLHEDHRLNLKSRPGLALLATAFRRQPVRFGSAHADPVVGHRSGRQPKWLQKDVVDAVAALANWPWPVRSLMRPSRQTPAIRNCSRPLEDFARRQDHKAAFAQGEEPIKLDTSFADTPNHFIRTVAAYAADSQQQKSAEFAAKG